MRRNRHSSGWPGLEATPQLSKSKPATNIPNPRRKSMTVLVKCTFTIPVEVPDDQNFQFAIEDNGCPGTGVVGSALAEHMAAHEEADTCWACALGGRCEIVQPTSLPYVT